uniref:Thrombospondin type 1 domain protein n=1 Tax=Panagrolaimus sp. JU765 TaxID=591449 RepID=A0AC34R0T6_9BILA
MCVAPNQVIEPPPKTCNCCPEQGIWSSWNEVNCSNTCGAYGTGFKRRTCLSEAIGCPCTGVATETGSCGLKLCSYPTKSCANGFKPKVLNNAFVCVNSSAAVQLTQCCPNEGLWNPWTEWSTCKTLCGGCSNITRTRTCASEPYGCPCKAAPTKESLPCNTLASPAPVTTTIPATTIPAPVWGEWTNTGCTDTCGMCGIVQRSRSCLSGACTGPSVQNSTTSCPDNLCAVGLGKPTCCPPSAIKAVNGKFVCGT